MSNWRSKRPSKPSKFESSGYTSPRLILRRTKRLIELLSASSFLVDQSRKVVRRRSSIKSSLLSSSNSTPSSLSSRRIPAEINTHHLYVRSGHALTLPSSKTCPHLPATSPNVVPTFKKRTLKERCSSPQNLSNNNNSLSGGNILSAILSRSTSFMSPTSSSLGVSGVNPEQTSSTTGTITTAPITITATTTPIPIVTTDSSTPTSTQLEPGMMITREYVVDEEDLEAPAPVI
ncbi:hypothetical protein K435DRAFT_800394 [Dendrothele bispora CBS 962.96]|uniref:Uncharacterized protein n=1 Tax=Dendrothele bispora (strain CBS 962.96) TaxID=1314807 RepID=A0A4S8LSS9_DENBC|nr:hypothetical protein K435DRAFT_800394 [Dendrothele bispora CBS 962.96]